MNALFLAVCNRLWDASFLMLAVLALHVVLYKAPRRVFPWLWGLVALRLVIPFSIPSMFCLLPSSAPFSEKVVQFSPVPSVQTGMPFDTAVDAVLADSFTAPVGASVNPLYIAVLVLGVIWLCGEVGMLGYMLISHLRLHHRMRTAVLYTDNIYRSDAIDSPFVWGILRPRIYLPFSLSEPELSAVLAHERAHLARRDTLWKPLGFLFLSIFWFHPLVWISYFCFCRDLELACDERVITAMSSTERLGYSEALLTLSTRGKAGGLCPVAFGEQSIKTRIKRILDYKKPGVWVFLLTAAFCVLVAVCFMTQPVARDGVLIEGIAAGDVFETQECLYISPLSSAGPGDDNGYRYTVGKEHIVIQNKEYEEQTATIPVEWKWEKFPWDAMTWEKGFLLPEIADAAGLERIYRLYSELRYQKLSDREGLIYADGDILLVVWSESQDSFLVWSVYRLQKTEG